MSTQTTEKTQLEKPKWPWMAVFRVANGFIVRCGLGGPHASEAEYVFNDPKELGKFVSEHAGDKS